MHMHSNHLPQSRDSWLRHWKYSHQVKLTKINSLHAHAFKPPPPPLMNGLLATPLEIYFFKLDRPIIINKQNDEIKISHL